MNRTSLTALVDAHAERRCLVRAVRLEDGTEWIIDPASEAFQETGLNEASQKALEKEEACLTDVNGDAYLVIPQRPAMRIFVIGAVHITQMLAPMAGLAGYDVTIIDPRGAFTEGQEFGQGHILDTWPDEALAAAKLDRDSAVITLTHDPKLDDAALRVALRSDCFYIGCLGSKKTHAARLGRLHKQGFSDEALNRIHGPVGLTIGAANAAEIALSIMAQITQVRRA